MNAYEVKAGIGVIAGNTVSSMPERLRDLTARRYINPLYFLPLPFAPAALDKMCCCSAVRRVPYSKSYLNIFIRHKW